MNIPRGRSHSRDIWSNINVKEVLPGVVPPLVSSMIMRIFHYAAPRSFGVDVDEMLLDCIHGRMYFNVSALSRGLGRRTSIPNLPVATLIEGKISPQAVLRRFSRTQKIWIMFLAWLGIFYSRFASMLFFRRMARVEDKSRTWWFLLTHADGIEEAGAIQEEIARYTEKSMSLGFQVLLHPLFLYYLFLYLCHRWLDDSTGQEAHLLLSHSHKRHEMVQAMYDLWEMRNFLIKKGLSAKFARATPTQARAILDSSPVLKQAYQEFLHKFGHRREQELNFSLPRWSEDDRFLLKILKSYLNMKNSASPQARGQALRKRRSLALRHIARVLPPWKKRVFMYLMRRAIEVLGWREDAKSKFLHLIMSLRRGYLLIGSMEVAAHRLERADDIFYLTEEEVRELVVERYPEQSRGMRSLVLKRRKIYQEYREESLPDQIMNPQAPHESRLNFRKSVATPKTFSGLGASHGIASGIARVVEHVEDIDSLLPGEILVTDHTDPGWTPVFAVIRGLVTNTGSRLSHAAIVAREYGLPAVVNIEHATSQIKTGNRLVVDANRGIVSIIT